MLKVMRKHAKYFYVLFVIIILSFIFWGTGTNDQGNTSVSIVVIGKEKVKLEEYWRAFDRMSDLYREIYQDKYDDKMREDLKETVLNDMIEDRILFIAAQEAGLVVTDQEVEDAITSESTFQRDGAFNSDVYLRTLELNRLSPQYFEENKRQSLLVKKMRTIIENSVDVLPSELAEFTGTDELKKTLTDTLLQSKKSAAVRSYVDGMMKSLNVQVNKDLIS